MPTLPSPEQLGIGSSHSRAAAKIDWNVVHKRLHDLGVLSSHLEKLEGGYRFRCVLPASGQGQPHPIEGCGETEGLAVQEALDRVEQFSSR